MPGVADRHRHHALPAAGDRRASTASHEVSLYVTGDGRRRRARPSIPTSTRSTTHLRTARELPTTSQPSVGDFLAVYEPLIERRATTSSRSTSRAGSPDGPVGASRRATQLLERGVDGGARSTSSTPRPRAAARPGGDRRRGRRARRRERRGGRGRASEARRNLKIWFAVDTLEFLRRGGRIGAAQAWLGSALKIKPILTIERRSTRSSASAPRAARSSGWSTTCSARRDEGADRFVVQHIQAPDQAEQLVDRGEAIYGTEPLFVSEIGPVIGTHAGPGLIGVTACAATCSVPSDGRTAPARGESAMRWRSHPRPCSRTGGP